MKTTICKKEMSFCGRDERNMNELALFAGIGGSILGGVLLGWKTVCAVEINKYAASVLLQRQNDGFLPHFPIWDDIRTFDGKSWKGLVDVVSGGFPCQDISSAGKRAGINGERSGLWKEMARIICDVRPQYAFVENSPMLTVRGLDRVLGDLAEMGYAAEWCVLGADDVGAPQHRKRIWILAYTDSTWEQQSERCLCKKRGRVGDIGEVLADTIGDGGYGWISSEIEERGWWESEPSVGRVASRISFRMDRLKGLGNAQVPICAAMAFKLLSKGMIK